MKLSPASVQARANATFSPKSRQSGCTAVTPVALGRDQLSRLEGRIVETPMSGRARVALVVVMFVAASTCGHSSPTVPATSPPEVGSSQLRISGLPASIRSGATAQLTAQEVRTSGTVRECAASWSVDDRQVASISPTGLLTARSAELAGQVRQLILAQRSQACRCHVVASDAQTTSQHSCGDASSNGTDGLT